MDPPTVPTPRHAALLRLDMDFSRDHIPASNLSSDPVPGISEDPNHLSSIPERDQSASLSHPFLPTLPSFHAPDTLDMSDAHRPIPSFTTASDRVDIFTPNLHRKGSNGSQLGRRASISRKSSFSRKPSLSRKASSKLTRPECEAILGTDSPALPLDINFSPEKFVPAFEEEWQQHRNRILFKIRPSRSSTIVSAAGDGEVDSGSGIDHRNVFERVRDKPNAFWIFIGGFLFPPLWWAGALGFGAKKEIKVSQEDNSHASGKHPLSRSMLAQRRWRVRFRWASIISFVAIIAIVVFAVVTTSIKENSKSPFVSQHFTPSGEIPHKRPPPSSAPEPAPSPAGPAPPGSAPAGSAPAGSTPVAGRAPGATTSPGTPAPASGPASSPAPAQAPISAPGPAPAPVPASAPVSAPAPGPVAAAPLPLLPAVPVMAPVARV